MSAKETTTGPNTKQGLAKPEYGLLKISTLLIDARLANIKQKASELAKMVADFENQEKEYALEVTISSKSEIPLDFGKVEGYKEAKDYNGKFKALNQLERKGAAELTLTIRQSKFRV